MNKLLVGVAASVAACGSPARAPAPPAETPAIYAALFAPGRSWTYQVDRVTEGDAPATESAQVTCKVVDTGEREGNPWSRIACDGAIHDTAGPHDDPVAGFWVATVNDGYLLPALPEEGTALDLGGFNEVIAEHPVEFTEPLMVSEHGGETVTERGVEARGELWCATRWDEFGYPNSRETCFGADGIVEGEQKWQGEDGSQHTTRYKLVR